MCFSSLFCSCTHVLKETDPGLLGIAQVQDGAQWTVGFWSNRAGLAIDT